LPALCSGTGFTPVEPLPDPEHHDARDLSELLAEHARTVRSERVSLTDIADLLRIRSIGRWLVILALPMVLPVPTPGISVLFGVPLMMISAQLALGGRRAWLTAVILRQSVVRADYAALVGRMQPAVKRFERIVRPRALWLANAPATLSASRSGGRAITKAENVGANICDFFRREDQVRHLWVRCCKEHP
jgi:hypothetical protein